MSEPSSLEPRMLERRISNNRFVLGYSIINKIILKIFLLGKLTWLNCIYRSLLVLCRKDPLQMDIGYIVDIIIQFCSFQAFFYNYCLVQLNHLNNATASQLTNNLLFMNNSFIYFNAHYKCKYIFQKLHKLSLIITQVK